MLSPNSKFFFIEGNIGCGKTKFLEAVASILKDKAQVLLEPVEKWRQTKVPGGGNVLEEFYKDPSKRAGMFNLYSTLTKVERFFDLDPSKKIVFIERPFETDSLLFGEIGSRTGSISEIEKKVHEYFISFIKEYLQLPKTVEFVYLSCEPKISFSRLKQRDRTEEKGVPLEYLELLNSRLEEIFRTKKLVSSDITILDVSKTFLSEKEYLEELILPFLKQKQLL